MGKNTTVGALALALLLQSFTLPSRAFACVVGIGTGASCTESALNACLPGGGSFDGSVTFNCGGAATITVTSTKTISADTTIDGASLITISGGNSVAIFHVNGGVGFAVRNLTIADGKTTIGTSGGIYNFGGTLTVDNSIITHNGASGAGGAGIYNLRNGTLTVTDSTFSRNYGDGIGGSGIAHESGTLIVTNTTFSDNKAYHGGGINGGGTFIVTNCTFSGNSAYNGGAIWNYNDGTLLTVTNSTFSGNSASNAGSGIYNSHSRSIATVTNSLFANGAAGDNCAGNGVMDGGHNIDDGTTCGFTGPGCAGMTGTSLCNTNPGLDSAGLQDNGGPTQTIAVCSGTGVPSAGCTGTSPAINAGDQGVCATTTGVAPVNNLDQRGFVRPAMGSTQCSIGAFEASSIAPPPSPTATPTSTPPPVNTPTDTPTPVASPTATCGSDGASCDDGLFCNGADTCQSGTCSHPGNPCSTSCQSVCVEASDTCESDPVAASCDDGDPCTLSDVCDGSGSCAGQGYAADYALLRWPTTPTPNAGVKVLLSKTSRAEGNVCADVINLRGGAEICGDAVAPKTTGVTVIVGKEASTRGVVLPVLVDGTVVTNGGTVGRGDRCQQSLTCGTATGLTACDFATASPAADPFLQQCQAASCSVAARRSTFMGFSADLTLGDLRLVRNGTQPLTVPPAGGSHPGYAVIDIAGDLRLANSAVLTIQRTAGVDKLILRIGGRLKLGRLARIDLSGITPSEVLFVVDDTTTLGFNAQISGTILGDDKVTVSRSARVHGAIAASKDIKLGAAAVVTAEPFVGW